MNQTIYYILSLIIAIGVLFGIKLLNDPKTAVKGNRTGAIFLLLAIILTMVHADIMSLIDIWIALAIGAVAGVVWASRVKMIQMPQLVSAFNGFGGAASMLVALILIFNGINSQFELYSALAAFAIGTFTFSGSMVATGKLSGKLPQKPVPFKSITSNLLVLAMIAWVIFPAFNMVEVNNILYILIGLAVSTAFGLVLTFRVGGADMPITISLLNSFSGVAGAIAGLAVNDPLLVAISGIVGASGLILTQIMCRAMNRNLGEILSGKTTTSGEKPSATTAAVKKQTPAATTKKTDLSSLLNNAKRVIIVPGYGMALAQAQAQVKQLADLLESKGVEVEFAIHPVAGRMPGHMNVLLAEVDVGYEQLKEMDEVNPLFADTDVAIIIGANDVVNSAANTATDTPIYGLPILEVDKAKHVIVCNFDDKPGYAGVDNPLYSKEEDVTLMWGDAKDSITKLISEANKSGESKETSSSDNELQVALQNAKRVIIVPGYGMALAQAQAQVKQLADSFESKGVEVEFAIHPVAGRMPGHMNVLLAEVDVGYEQLK
ncbi:MAG: NAD(P)(+) transhydrogenase (Re/Si-specific) subunit beta, partial [Erysipelotrichales bacterium]